MPSFAQSSRSAGSRVPGGSSPSLIAVPSRSTVSSNAVCERTGANTVSSEVTAARSGSAARRRGCDPSSQPLESAEPLPVGDRGVERSQLDIGGVDIVVDDLVAERRAGHRARSEQLARVAQRTRQPRLVVREVGVAGVDGLELESQLDAVQPSSDDRAQREVRIQVRAAGAVLEAQRCPMADDAQRAGAVVLAPRHRGRSERALRRSACMS